VCRLLARCIVAEAADTSADFTVPDWGSSSRQRLHEQSRSKMLCTWLALLCWRRRKNFPRVSKYIITRLECATLQKFEIVTVTAVRTWNLTKNILMKPLLDNER
jgi:hypothetical protein